jgi:phosphoserine phosphatase RsbU/P
MLRSRLPAALRPRRPTPPDVPRPFDTPSGSPPSIRALLLRSRAGRLFLASAAIKLVLGALRLTVPLPAVLDLVGTMATVGLVAAAGWFLWRLFVRLKRRLLWRVRRKLILSYIFIGVVPALLIITFFMLGAWVVATNVSAYLFRDGYDDVVAHARLAAAAAAAEIGRDPSSTEATVVRAQRVASEPYPALSVAFVPSAAGGTELTAGAWRHADPPDGPLPPWVLNAAHGFAGTIARDRRTARAGADLTVRAVAPVLDDTRRFGHVIVDVPVDAALLLTLYEVTGVRAGSIGIGGNGAPAAAAPLPRPETVDRDRFALFRRGVTFLDTYDWDDGEPHRATIDYTYAFRELYEKLSSAQSAQVGAVSLGQAILWILLLVAVLFLIIQFVALVMGLALARSITSSIHELFTGTERVRHGDFSHRISVQSGDQLGELAASFNQMTGSIENLLQTAAEKKRLEEELRIARQIQMSLLPRGALDVPGLSITALCVPAREVGGDYYDFFPLGSDRLGVLIADVAGKGTSAALYMAELKGLVLSLSQIYQSPRQLLIEVNRIISENLDSRTFITMTYAVLDMAGGTMAYARAGHTPVIHARGGAEGPDRVQILVPSGMVVGLRIPGAAEKFAELLEEAHLALGEGDIVVLYTDGITEAMNADADLFGDARLSEIVEEHGHLGSAELRERVLREIEAFVGAADQHDDMTMILLKVEQVAPRGAASERAMEVHAGG